MGEWLRSVIGRTIVGICVLALFVALMKYSGTWDRFVEGVDILTGRGEDVTEVYDQAQRDLDHLTEIIHDIPDAGNWLVAQGGEIVNDVAIGSVLDGITSIDSSDNPLVSLIPGHGALRCEYALRYVGIASQGNISISPEDRTKIEEALATCP